MKKVITLFFAFLIVSFSDASSPGGKLPKKPDVNAAEVFINVGNSGAKISLLELSTISKSDLEALTGKKMSYLQKVAFNASQRKLKKGINSDGVVTNKKLKKVLGQGGADGESGFHLGGFALGFLGGLIGVLLAYVVFKDDNKQNRIKWAWLGVAAALVLSLLIFAVLI